MTLTSKEEWDKSYSEQYSPIYDPNKTAKETGKQHEWYYQDSDYYDSAYRCRLCGKKNWGWNLWKEDWEPTCPGRKTK